MNLNLLYQTGDNEILEPVVESDTILAAATETILSGKYTRTQSSSTDVLVKDDTQINASYPAAIRILSSGRTVTVEGGNLNCSGTRNGAILFGEDASGVVQASVNKLFDGTVTFTGATATLNSQMSDCIIAAGIIGDNVTVNFSGEADGSSGIRFQSTNGNGPGNAYCGISVRNSLTINGTFGCFIVAQCDFSTLSSKRGSECRGLGSSTASVKINGDISGTILVSAYTGDGYSSYVYGIRAGYDKSLTVSGDISGTIITLSMDGKYACGISGGTVQLSVSGKIWAGKSTAGQTEAQVLSVIADTQTNKQLLKESSSDSRAIYAYEKDTSISILAGAEIYGQIYLAQQGTLSVSSSAEITGYVRCGALTFVLENQAASSPILGNDLSSNTISIDAEKAVNGRYILVDNMSDSSISRLYNIRVNNRRESVTWQKSGSSEVSFSTGETFQFSTSNHQLVLTVSSSTNQPDDDRDTVAPTLQGTPRTNASHSYVSISWNPATDNVGVAGYRFRYGTTATLSGSGITVHGTTYSLTDLAAETYYYQIQAYDAEGNFSDWSSTETFTIENDTAVCLPYEVPQAEYMYGCTATVAGMLLGYYDRYGYQGYDVSNLIRGTVELNARGLDGNAYNMNAFDTVLGSAIASPEYRDRFYGRTPAEEYPYTLTDNEQLLNVDAWNCIADYLGTGQYWRGNSDLSSRMYYTNLEEMREFSFQRNISGDGISVEIPAEYSDFLYGLDLYVRQAGYQLDAVHTATTKTDNYGGTFTFEDYQHEIDAGRAVIIHIAGHAMLGYGYDAETREIIFDNTYRHDCRMTWGGTYYYSSAYRELRAISTVQFDQAALSVVSDGIADLTGDGGTDVLIHDADGTVKTVSTAGQTQEFGSLSLDRWRILAAEDFDHDGNAEAFCLEKNTGHIYCSGTLTSGLTDDSLKGGTLLGTLTSGYEFGGAGNFTDDGQTGALLLAPEQVSPGFSKVTGLACWIYDDLGNMSPGWLGALVTTYDGVDFTIPDSVTDPVELNRDYYSFELVGVGDFNGDGKDDVMLQNTMPTTVDGKRVTGSGDVFVFLTDTKENVLAGTRPDDGIVYSGCATNGWNIVEFGDFNNDGTDDVLLRNLLSGELACWLMRDGQMYESIGMGTPSLDSSVAGVGDFDADGTDDILLCDANNNLAAWSVKDGKVTGVITIA